MVVGSWSTVPIMVSSCLSVGPRTSQPSRKRFSRLPRSHKSIPWKNTSCCWFLQTRPFPPILWTLLISPRAKILWQSVQRKFKVMPISSRQELVLGVIWSARSKHQPSQAQSRSTSQWTIWPRERRSRLSAKCSKVARIPSSHLRFVQYSISLFQHF